MYAEHTLLASQAVLRSSFLGIPVDWSFYSALQPWVSDEREVQASCVTPSTFYSGQWGVKAWLLRHLLLLVVYDDCVYMARFKC